MEDNRSKILACAIDLFSSRGFDAVGVQEVADAAGLKKPTLYHYFGSKSGLLKTVLDETFVDLFTALEKVEYNRKRGGLARSDCQTSISTLPANTAPFIGCSFRCGFPPLKATPSRQSHQVNERQQQILEALFLQAANDHGNMRGRHQAYAATFLGMLNTYIALGL